MTIEEAIEIVTNAIQTEKMTAEQDRALAIVQKAAGKQVPEKPLIPKGNYNYIHPDHYYICPSCRRFVTVTEQSHGKIKIPHCKWCGQAFDWSDAE